MHLTLLDWSIVAGLVAVLFLVAAYSRRYTRSVSDFLAANRCAGRYMLTLSDGVASFGAAAIIANFEKFYQAGFGASWWGTMLLPVSMVVALTGWVVFRYRETRAMTMAQLFEMRYSKRFRVFAGVLGWISGMLNYGVFPAITARFLVTFCGLPESFDFLGFTWTTFPVVMAALLSIALCFVLFGGMVAVMITDFLQAQFMNIAFLVIMVALFAAVIWGDMLQTLAEAPPGKSMTNPFDQQAVSDFTAWFFMIFAFKAVYNCLGWQGNQGYNCAARTPHEAKMARVLAEWRNGVTFLMLALMPVAAYVLLHGADFTAEAARVNAELAALPDAQSRQQMTTPLAMLALLPIGVIGIFAAAMVAAAIATDDSQIHSWGTIFIQDVVMPFRKTPFTTGQHLFFLRLSMVGVAVFAFFWSLYFPLRDYLLMYFLLTGTIYLGGSGAVIIGGLYWRKGTTAGAWAAMITGATIGIAGMTLQAVWPSVPALVALAPVFPINGSWLAMSSYILSILAYVGVSLLTCREDYNLDALLHRGKYRIAQDHLQPGEKDAGTPGRFWKILGMTSEFTRGDRFIYYLKLGWTGFFVLTFLIGTVWALTLGIPASWWNAWWTFYVGLTALVGLITIVWFLWGGIIDLRQLVRDLSKESPDENDDGTIRTEAASPPSHK
jgi:SSS family solute:Na+ symporter